MSEIENDVENISPYKLLGHFSKSRVVPCVFLAAIIHVGVIGGLSYDFIYHTWINPTKESTEVTDADAGKSSGDADEPEGAQSDESSDAPASPGDGDTADGDTPEGVDPNAPIVQKTNERANPDEIPDEPTDIGFSIDDTNP